MSPNTDPDIRRYDGDEDFRPCSLCGTWLLSLQEYEMGPTNESLGGNTKFWQFVLWGWTAFIYNYVIDFFFLAERQRKLAALKSEILPEFPHSLICPGCLDVTRKR